jgi:hypothetical protein
MSRPAKKRAPIELALVGHAPVRGHRWGRISGLTDAGLLVDYDGNPHGPLLAQTTLALAPDAVRAAIAEARDVLLVFEEERAERPILIGLREPAPTAQAPTNTTPLQPPVVEAAEPILPAEALVDGRRVVLDARDEIVLRCGEASITLRRNGRVVIRGAYVETRSRGVNRIKGGSVQIN